MLHSLGVIREKTAETSVLVRLRDIDPVYAVTNDPSLAEDTEFLSEKKRYASEIAVVSNILKENGEPSKEPSSHLKFR